jgi:hypothetical protein
MEQGHPYVKLIVGGALVGSALNDMKGAFLSEDFAYCMAWSKTLFNDDDQPMTGENGYENNE